MILASINHPDYFLQTATNIQGRATDLRRTTELRVEACLALLLGGVGALSSDRWDGRLRVGAGVEAAPGLAGEEEDGSGAAAVQLRSRSG
jgi:hypothetical protein